LGFLVSEEIDEGKRSTLKQVGGIGAIAPLFADLDIVRTEGDTSNRMTRLVSISPGIHFSRLRDDLSIGTGETQYHVRNLESEAVIMSERDGDYRRFFIDGDFSSLQRRILGCLRRDTAGGILIELLRKPDLRASDLAAELGVSAPAISTQGALLEERGLLDRDAEYQLVHPTTTITVAIRYANTLGARAQRLAGESDQLVAYDHSEY
jgi:predicted transcriptional regulator